MITVTEISNGIVIIIDQSEDLDSFKKLIQRGANLWPDAPASIKGFADIITVGHIQQDYSAQDTSFKKEKVNYHEF